MKKTDTLDMTLSLLTHHASRYICAAFLFVIIAFNTEAKSLNFELQTRDANTGEIKHVQETVDSAKIAIVIVDPWNYHWCMTACERVSAMVPRWNRALECAHKLNLPIIWCPSDVVAAYSGWPQRERAMALEPIQVPEKGKLSCNFTAAVWGCMCGPGLSCVVNYGENAIHPELVIAETDYIASSTEEVYTILKHHGITHVIYLGLHTNMCLFGKPGALKYMADAGLVCWLGRDINDAFTHYDPATNFTPDRGTQQTDEDLERAGIPTINVAEEWRKAGLWDDNWMVETVRITPWGKPYRPFVFEHSVEVTLTAPWLKNVEIRYTLTPGQVTDESKVQSANIPKADSLLYSKPVRLTETATLKAVAYRNGHPVSIPTSAYFLRLPHPGPKPDVALEKLTPIIDPYAQAGAQGFFSIPKAGRSFQSKALRIRGKKYEQGLGFRAPSSVRYSVDPEYDRFVARVGVADDILEETHGFNQVTFAKVICRVFADGSLAAQSPVLRVSQEPWRFHVPIPKGTRHISLACVDAGGFYPFNLVNWVDAGFIYKEGSTNIARRAETIFPLHVSGAWENAPGGRWKNFDGIAWYRCYVHMPASWANHETTLEIERVDNAYEAYVNATKVGEGDFDHGGRHPVPAICLRAGAWNKVAVRVDDWGGAGGFRGQAPVLSSGNEAISLEGHWEFCTDDDDRFAKWSEREAPPAVGRFERVVTAKSLIRQPAFEKK
jgi:hypothetical protein